MKKEIVFLLVMAVLVLGCATAVFESVTIFSWDVPSFDPGDSDGGTILTPDGDDIPEGCPL